MTEAAAPLRAEGGTDPWTIETPHLTLAFGQTDAGDITLASLKTGGREWVASARPLFTVDASNDASTALRDATITREDGVTRLTGTLAPSGLTVLLDLEPDPDASIVTAAIRVRNDTDAAVELGALSSLGLTTPATDRHQLHVLAGGRWNEATPPRGYRLETFDMNELRRLPHVAAAADGRSSGEYVPWLALTGDGAGVVAALAWSGRWRLGVARDGDATTLSLGIADFSHTLAPGDEIEMPGYILQGFEGDLDQAANTWRGWVAAHWTPETPDNWPWVQYNHWYAYYGDIDEERLMLEAGHAAAAGCEVFVIDDGWFVGRRPDSYHEGWGNWHEDRAKFPGGLRAFGDALRAQGMKFGLWVEPERADPDGPVVREHPEFVGTRDGKPITRLPDGTGGVHLCLGSPAVQEWMAADMIRVVKDYGVDWLKWDYNLGYGLGCDNPDHGHQAGDGHHAHTLGLYRVLEALREACPDLVIENCASGGHRVDMGTLRQTHTNWLSDYTSRASSCRQHAQGAGMMLPLAHCNTWVLDERDTTELRSRMGGAFGVSWFLDEWSDAEREELRLAIADYKRLRPMLAGARYLLSGPLHQDWDIWQFLHPSAESFAVLAFHDPSQIDAVTARLRDLPADRRWRIERSSGGDPMEMATDDLLASGLAFQLGPGESEIVWGTVVDE